MEVDELVHDWMGDWALGWALAMEGATTPLWSWPQLAWASRAGDPGIPLAPYMAIDPRPLALPSLHPPGGMDRPILIDQ